jgi:outer membrane protein assembly factor BamB
MAYYNNKLYIGDNNGILWAFDVAKLNLSLRNSLVWASDVGSAITGGITVGNDGTVYFGAMDNSLYYI